MYPKVPEPTIFVSSSTQAFGESMQYISLVNHDN